MKNACILCNLIETFWWKKVIKDRKMKTFWPFQALDDIVYLNSTNLVVWDSHTGLLWDLGQTQDQ
jgi:hypothetical protein